MATNSGIYTTTLPLRTLFGLLLLIVATTITPAYADDPGPPHLEYWSANHRYVLHIDAKTAMLALYRAADHDANKSAGARETSIWSVSSPMKDGRRIPAAAYIRDDGKFVVLRDQYAGAGHGTVLAFLDACGGSCRTYTLDDLFSQTEISQMVISVSSIWWSADGLFRFFDTGDKFGFLTNHGVVGVFELSSGNRLPDTAPECEALRKEALRIERRDLGGATGSDLDPGVTLARALRDVNSVPRLAALLTDPEHCQAFTTGRHSSQYDFYDRQIQAGYALVEILGAKAAPLIEARLKGANAYMAAQWLSLLGPTGVAGGSTVVLRETESADDDVRTAAISAVTKKGGADAVRKHPSWLEDPSSDIRMRSVDSLAKEGDMRDLPALRRSQDDSAEVVRLSGLLGLIRLNAPDLNLILRSTVRAYPGDIEAHIALASRGDQEQQKWCVDALSHFADAWQRDHETDYARFDGTRLYTPDLQPIAKAVARHNVESSRAALTRITTLPGNIYTSPSFFQSVGFGGLAALGDPAALARVRALASDHDLSASLNAIEWLGICQDQASAPLLRQLLRNREVEIREASRRALASLGAPEIAEPPPAPTTAEPTRSKSTSARSAVSWLVPIGLAGLGLVCLRFARASKNRRRPRPF